MATELEVGVPDDLINGLASSDAIDEREVEEDQHLLPLPQFCILKFWVLKEFIYTA